MCYNIDKLLAQSQGHISHESMYQEYYMCLDIHGFDLEGKEKYFSLKTLIGRGWCQDKPEISTLPITVIIWGSPNSQPSLGSHHFVTNDVVCLLIMFELKDHTKGDIMHELICYQGFEKEKLETKILFKKERFSKWMNHNHSLIFEKN